MRRLLSTCIAVTIGATALGVGAAVPANAATTTPSTPSVDWAWTAKRLTDEGNRVFRDSGGSVDRYEYGRFTALGDASWEPTDDPTVVGGKVPLVPQEGQGAVCWQTSPTDHAVAPVDAPFFGMKKPDTPSRIGQWDLLDGSSTVVLDGLVSNTVAVREPLADQMIIDFSTCDSASHLTGDYYIQGASTTTGSFSSKDALDGSDSWFEPVRLNPGRSTLSPDAAVTATMVPGSSTMKLDFTGLSDADRAALRQGGAGVNVEVTSLTDDDKQLTQEIKLTFTDEPAKAPAPPAVVTVGDPGPGPGIVFDTGIDSQSPLGFWGAFGISLPALGGVTLLVTAVRDLRQRRASARQR